MMVSAYATVPPCSLHLLSDLMFCHTSSHMTYGIRKSVPHLTIQTSPSADCVVLFSAGSQRIVSTSRDNTLQVWDAQKGLARGAVMKHNNNTGRWISPFRAVWTPAADAIVVGNMGRQVLAGRLSVASMWVA
jgi:WD40 repeat protein